MGTFSFALDINDEECGLAWRGGEGCLPLLWFIPNSRSSARYFSFALPHVCDLVAEGGFMASVNWSITGVYVRFVKGIAFCVCYVSHIYSAGHGF